MQFFLFTQESWCICVQTCLRWRVLVQFKYRCLTMVAYAVTLTTDPELCFVNPVRWDLQRTALLALPLGPWQEIDLLLLAFLVFPLQLPRVGTRSSPSSPCPDRQHRLSPELLALRRAAGRAGWPRSCHERPSAPVPALLLRVAVEADSQWDKSG